MTSSRFTMSLADGKKRVLYVCGFTFALLLAGASFFPVLTLSMRLLCYGGIVFVLVLMLMASMVRYDVDGTMITVRTSLGRRYQISCAEIDFVACNHSNHHRHGADFSITIVWGQSHFTVSGQVANFNIFAGYLLEKLENGEINASAVSEACRAELLKFQQGIHQ